MKKLLSNPESVLGDVQRYASATFRRLYRNRNYVLHGGNTTPVGLDSTLRNAAPLVGAGVDRIVHAYIVLDRTPIATASKAELGLRFVGETRETVTDLLE